MENDDQKTECHCTCHEVYETFTRGELISDGTSYWCDPCWNKLCDNG